MTSAMTSIHATAFCSPVAGVGVLLALLLGVGSCGEGETRIRVTLANENPDAEVIKLTPWLSDQMGEIRWIPITERELVLRVPAGLGGILRLDAEAVSRTLVGCTMGRSRTEVTVVPGSTQPIIAVVDLSQMNRAQCPLEIESGEVRVTADSPVINSKDFYRVDLPAGTKVTLTAVMPAPKNMVFWGGDCSSTELSCEVEMTQARRVFVQEGPENRPRMIRLMPGTFLMGSPLHEIGRFQTEQQHLVEIKTAFAISETPVTQGQYMQLMGTNPSRFAGDPNRPVEQVSWLDAVKYCNRLSARELLRPCYQIDDDKVRWDEGLECLGYRLPTEAEWEYAARVDSLVYQPYAGSDNVDDVAWYSGNSDSTTHAVRTKAGNRAGLYDMNGNVWTWMWDWHGTYPTIPLSVDPLGAQSGEFRIARGGSWSGQVWEVRVAHRAKGVPGTRYADVGFRLVRSYH